MPKRSRGRARPPIARTSGQSASAIDKESLHRDGLLTDPSRETPVFVRFLTVAGSRGSTDCARDVRGFAVKFYSDEGIWDLVGNNMPVFFIQNAIKFPDLIHAVKPEPNNEIPQAASAHDTFLGFRLIDARKRAYADVGDE
jgi:catalase